MKSIVNIAILAHVDAGKTSLTERLLFGAGAIKKAGHVDKGTAATDFLDVERDRGISVESAQVSIQYNDIQINIIDTPGHVDFMSEVERSLMAVDAVVLIVSAADGVQAQTRVLWHMLDQLHIPRLILINKIDREAVDLEAVIDDINNELSVLCLPVQQVKKQDDSFVITNFLEALNHENHPQGEAFLEQLIEFDDDLMERYLAEETIETKAYKEVYRKNMKDVKLYPILFSVAKTGFGVEELLKEIAFLYDSPKTINEERFSAVVYRILHHPQFGKLSYIRLFSGELRKKDLLYNQRLKQDEKVNMIKAVFSDKFEDVEVAGQGEIVSVSGLSSAMVGDVLGEVKVDTSFSFNTVPILTVQVKPVSDQDYMKLSDALGQMSAEDPLLQFRWFKQEKEFHISVNGWIQIEILKQILKDRFLLETEFLAPSIIYKETPSSSGYGYEEYTMPKPCWAVVKFKIEAGAPGSGVVYESQVGVNDILLKYQKEVERTIPLALEQGIKGWEVSDIKITLVGGEDHNIHSRAGDFVVATPMGIMNGLRDIGTDILEPVMSFEIHGPDDILGQITSDIHQMRGEFEQPELSEGRMILRGKLPAATSMEYPVKLASRTAGRASIQMLFHSYQKVDDSLAVVRDFKGISPLDRAKYILKARKAIQ